MLEQGFSAVTPTTILPIPVPERTITQAAHDTGIPARTIRALCTEYGQPLAHRDGRNWRVDTDLLRELAEQRRTGPGANVPTPAKPIPDHYRLTPDEAAAILDIPDKTIRRWCANIPKLALKMKGDRGEWRIEPALLGIVAFHWRTETGALPDGAMVRGSPQQRRLLHDLLKQLARHNDGASVLPADYLIAVETCIARRTRIPPAAAVQLGEVRHGQG